MKLLELFKSNDSKFFAVNTKCRTIKAGYVYFEDKKVWIPSDTIITIEYFDLYKDKVRILIDGRQKAEVTYEYLMDCVTPITVNDTISISGIQLLQRVNYVLSNEIILKLVIISLIFIVGLLVGKVF